MNDKLSTIEAALFKREVENLNKEIGRGLAIICEAINTYRDERNSNHGRMRVDSLKGLNEYIQSCQLVSTYYTAGDWLAEGNARLSDNFDRVPEFLRSLILKRATENFLSQVESVDEIRNIAESAYQNQQQ